MKLWLRLVEDCCVSLLIWFLVVMDVSCSEEVLCVLVYVMVVILVLSVVLVVIWLSWWLIVVKVIGI